nr:gamma-glutamylcyclotransferase [Rhodoligotrophos appendicifer]
MQEFWIFGYGSLMWRPGFEYLERRLALLRGAHRSLCVYSHVHRGTPEHPGLVLGLDTGGSCKGVAFRVSEANWEATIAYLREREQVTMVYREAVRPILLGGESPMEALVYLIDRKHPQYSGKLGLDQQMSFILQGRGVSGSCPDYVRSTVEHLRELGIHDSELEAIYAKLDREALLSHTR